MTAILSRLKAFVGSLWGQLALILTLGLATASIGSLLVAERARINDLDRDLLRRVVASTADISARMARDPAGTDKLLHEGHLLGVRLPPPKWRDITPEPDLSRMLTARLGAPAQPEGMLMPRPSCFPNFNVTIRAAGTADQYPECWYVRFLDDHGVEHRLAVDLVPFHPPRSSTLDPLFLCLIVLASAVLSLIVARIATKPLRRLTEAARAFSVTIDPEPIPEHGPSEVRAALQTFNIMQHRVRDGFRERTQILASIAHDLQTPLTRLRLRLEHVGDESLRNRLIADLAVTQQLVRDGLDLARSSESREPWSVADVDSILSSVAEDASEFGAAVSFHGGCGAHARIKPNALLRCLNNLVDNAIKYAGDAELSCEAQGDDIVIRVRDHGPGIPEQVLEEVLQPFRRLNGKQVTSNGGTGIGLTIARAQAETFGAALTLENHPDGGLLATVRFARQ